MNRRTFFLSGVAAGLLARPSLSADAVPVKRFYLDSRYGQLHGYRVDPVQPSAKPPLICLHQTPSSAKIFINFLVEMGRDRTAIAFDNPGYGASDGPVGRVTLETYAEIIAEGLEALGYGPAGYGQVDMLGMLTGAKISGELARTRPDLVRRLILV